MSSYQPKANEKLVGRRIPEWTPLGKELVRLREMFGLAKDHKLSPEQLEEARLRALTTSVNMSMRDGIERDSRKRAIRKQLCDSIHAVYLETGEVPKTVGVPKPFVEEARAAMIGSEYQSVKVVPEVKT